MKPCPTIAALAAGLSFSLAPALPAAVGVQTPAVQSGASTVPCEMNSPIIAIANGVPALYVRQPGRHDESRANHPRHHPVSPSSPGRDRLPTQNAG